MLPRDQFLQLVDRAPLLCLDLLITDPEGKTLLGWRKNAPAKNSWFVPGGSVMKNERIEDAFARITQVELGYVPPFEKTLFRGVHQHFFALGENFANDPTINTHCIVLAYEVPYLDAPHIVGDSQHGDLHWFTPEELLAKEDVHPLTKDYFTRQVGLDLGQPPR